MSLSHQDRPCDATFIPKSDYKVRTAVDENLVEVTARESMASLVYVEKEGMNDSYIQRILRRSTEEYPAAEKLTQTEVEP